ncbi:LCP family protein required for cell wall assembly [Gracilibacillus halotolerans]|uniref:LCP family protein required for cell wall assembly n=1 Tax=Gracilibacillus halotolerans TaxID=74386 RepID=A0A841RLJ8_9BACI|nr:LCP family protein required for cell wall assembly [Gracilibacillus halotolerans]
MGRRSEIKQKKKSKKWWILTPLLILLALIVAAGIYVWSIVNNVQETVDSQMHETVESIDQKKAEQKVKAKDPINILLLGVDQRAGDSGRSDAIIVMTLKPETDEMLMVSIPRDTRALMVGKGTTEKINHAYAHGGPDMAINSVENLLGIEIDHFVRINMEGLKELVDAVGGITVQNELEWNDGKYEFTKGPVTMDGDKALAFVRMRKDDSRGDFGRTDRQRLVIEQIVKKGATVGNVTKINDVLAIMGDNVGTSLQFSDMNSLLTGYNGTIKNTEDYLIQGTGKTIDNTYYYIVPDEEFAKVREMIES